jgi:hypothetical protein
VEVLDSNGQAEFDNNMQLADDEDDDDDDDEEEEEEGGIDWETVNVCL